MYVTVIRVIHRAKNLPVSTPEEHFHHGRETDVAVSLETYQLAGCKVCQLLIWERGTKFALVHQYMRYCDKGCDCLHLVRIDVILFQASTQDMSYHGDVEES